VSFEEKIRSSSETNGTKIVLALDIEDPDRDDLVNKATKILRQASNYICAVKINRQLVLSLGLHRGVDSIVKLAHELSLPAIMDAKLNDVGHTNEFMMRSYIDAGFDSVIASPVAGWEGGLDSVFELARSRKAGVILLIYMSNPGAESLYSLKSMPTNGTTEQVFELFAKMAVQWNANGVIVAATRPDIITRVRGLVGSNMPIFSPGVGAQRGDATKAIAAGSDYLIVGRSIYGATDPGDAAKRFRDLAI
jgi:orotidine-5'-phosphate decarboxylase